MPFLISRVEALAQPILTRDEELELIAAWQERADQSAADRIVVAYMRLCFNIANFYTSNQEHAKDLAQEGVFGIRRALLKYDPTRGTRFSTFVRRYIQNAIAEKISAVSTDVSVPSRVLLDVRAGRISEEGNTQAYSAAAPLILLDAPNHQTGVSVAEQFPDPCPSPEELVAQSSTATFHKRLIATSMASLGERERQIVHRRHLADPPETLEEIGRDLGITRERVRQLEATSLLKIRKQIVAITGGESPLE